MTIEAIPTKATCIVCGEPMTGRADRRYCSSACRQRAYRTSQRPDDASVEVQTAQGMYEQCRALTEPWMMDQLSPGVRQYLAKTLRDAAAALDAHNGA